MIDIARLICDKLERVISNAGFIFKKFYFYQINGNKELDNFYSVAMVSGAVDVDNAKTNYKHTRTYRVYIKSNEESLFQYLSEFFSANIILTEFIFPTLPSNWGNQDLRLGGVGVDYISDNNDTRVYYLDLVLEFNISPKQIPILN